MRLSSPSVAILTLGLCTGAAHGLAQDAADASAFRLDLSPKAAARTLEEPPEAPPRRNTPRALSERDLSEGVPGLVRLSDATLGQKAAYQFNRAVWRILQFWKRPPESRPVRYFYIGRAIDVAIHDDGSYDVRDKRGLSLTVASTRSLQDPSLQGTSRATDENMSNPEGAPARPYSGVAIGFREPERMLQNILTGKQRPSAEVRTFLEASRPLREHLLDREARRAQATASERMNAELRSIWQAPGLVEQKQQDTFALWDQSSEDETGALARRHIEAFVRELAVRRGACPYAAADLTRLNQRRRSKARFSPCDLADAGVAPDTSEAR